MRLQFQCPQGCDAFCLPTDSPVTAILERVAEEGPWASVGDGETPEDQVYTLLCEREPICCPECGSPSTASEESLSRFAREMLTSW